MILRQNYKSKASKFALTDDQFMDLSVYSTEYQQISDLQCVVILLFMLNIINHVSYIFSEIKFLTDSMFKVN